MTNFFKIDFVEGQDLFQSHNRRNTSIYLMVDIVEVFVFNDATSGVTSIAPYFNARKRLENVYSR